MFRQTGKRRWRKTLAFNRVRDITIHRQDACISINCLDRQPTPSKLSSVRNLPMLRFSSESNRKGRDQSLRLLKVPDHHLIPPAYRIYNPRQDERKSSYEKFISNPVIDTNRRGSSSQQFRRPSPHIKVRANNSSLSPWRDRRKPPLGKHGSSIPRKSPSFSKHHTLNVNGDDFCPDIENIRQLEDVLSVRMSEYNSRVDDFSSLDFYADAEKITSWDRAESTLTFLLGSTNYSQSNGPRDPHASELYATEKSYERIVSDFKALIIGWSEIAESICAAKQVENSSGHNGNITLDGLPAESIISVFDYEDAILRAERHLESFETLYRNRVNFISKGKSSLEELNKKREEARQASDKQVIGKISSLLGSFFSNSTSPTTFDLDQSWKRPDEKESALGVGEPQMTLSSENMIPPPKHGDLNPSTSLYEHVLLANHSSHCFGRVAKEASTQRSNRLLNRWISLYCLSNSNNAAMINCDTRTKSNSGEEATERKLFHAVIRQNVELLTVDGVQRAEDWLRRMRYLKKSGRGNCAPDVDTFNLVLLGFCNLCKLFRHNRPKLANRGTKSEKDEIMTRQFIVDGVERVLLELNEFKDEGPSPNIMSLNLALTAIAKAGCNFPETNRHRTNSLIFNIVGEEKYRSIFADVETKKCKANFISLQSRETESGDIEHSVDSSKSFIDPNLDTYHWVVDIYSASDNAIYTKQGMTLLRKMIQIRIEEDSDCLIHENGSRNASASFAPSTGTHNNVLCALVGKVENLREIPTRGNDAIQDADRALTAKEATDFLDSMVQYVSSFPTPVTFLFMLQMWQKTRSPEAGDRAEEILSRMEIVGMYQNELKHFSTAYVLALECWLTAAKAGRSGAAECAFRLLEMIEVQAGRDRTFSVSLDGYEEFETRDVFDRSMLTHVRMYPLMMNICAATYNKHDSSRAMAIAFQIYDKMLYDRIKPSLGIFEMMYICVRNFLDHHPEEERKGLLQKVFEPASKLGITRGELMRRHNQLLRKGDFAA